MSGWREVCTAPLDRLVDLCHKGGHGDWKCRDMGCSYYTRISPAIEVDDGHVSERGGQDTERGDMASDERDPMLRAYEEVSQAFDNAIAAFEELAGEHRELEEAFFHDAEVLSTPCPGDPEDYTFVRAYYRPRRSKLAAIDPDQGTVQAAPGEGQSGASGGQPEAFSIDLNPDETGVVTNAVSLAVDHDCTVTNFQGVEGKDWHYTEAFQWQGEVQCPIPQSGEERIE
jgi:hypothetical protein